VRLLPPEHWPQGQGVRVRATLSRKLLWIWLLAATAAASAQQIQFAEPIDLTRAGSQAQFDAYGRRFSLTLTDNERLLQKLSPQRKQALQPYRLLRGTVDGQPGSWVRLLQSAEGTEGAIWDGKDLYAVTRYERAADWLTTPLAVAPEQSVIYRLSDASDLLPRDFCGLDDPQPLRKQSTLDQYRTLVAQLGQVTQASITRQIEIALIADSAFASKEGDPTAAMLARLNVVEGIFSEQVGLLVLATELRVVPEANDPFTSTKGTTLLEQLGSYRAADPAVRARGLAHLMTGKNLDGTTAGIAYVSTTCDVERGVSISERSYGTTISALIMAHELGHNFGAPHDGEDGACKAVTGGFIMAPSITGYVTFSSCSVDVMQAELEKASCVVPASYADVAVLPGDSNLSAEAGLPFNLTFVVGSTGTNAAQDAALALTLPENAGLTLQSVSAEGAGCPISGVSATCSFGDLAPGTQRTVSLTARGTLAGTVTVKARASADNDRLTSNNSRDVSVSLRSGVDAAVAVSTDQDEIAIGTPLQVYVDVRSLRALSVRNAVLSVNLNQPVTSANMPGATCSVNQYSIICNVAEIAAGSTGRLTVNATAAAAGPLVASANVNVSGDGDYSNNTANARAWVQAERDIELTAGPGTVDLGVGVTYEIPFVVRSRGPQPTGDVTLSISIPSTAAVVESLDADGAVCSQADATRWICEFGAIAPQVSHLLRLRLHGDRSATVDVNAVANAADDGYVNNNSAAVQLRIDNLVDVAVVMASGGTGLEDEDFDGQVTLRSGGRNAASNATLDVELNAAGVLRKVALHNGNDCELLSPQRARCALPVMARGSQVYVNYRASFAEPGTYDVKFSLNVPGDTAPANDSLTRPVLVRPYYDAGVSGTLDLSGLVVGGSRETTFNVTAGRRALASAKITAWNALPGLRVAAIRAAASECKVTDDGGICDLTDLAADSSLAVTVTWKAEAASDEDVTVTVNTPSDVLPANNSLKGQAEVLAPTDLELRVAATASATSGTTLDFPPISIVNGGARAVGTRLEVTLPPEVALVSVSAAGAMCSGTAVLRCDFASLDANSTATVNISVQAGARGSYLSAVRLSSVNDTNPANDVGEVRFEIAGTPAVPAPKSGGGGGRFEWLSLLLLALLKWGQTPFAGRWRRGWGRPDPVFVQR